MANISVTKNYDGRNVLVTLLDNGDGTYAEAMGVTFDGTLNLTVAPTSIADGDDVAEGATTAAAIITDTTGTISGKLRGLVKWAFERMPASLGQKAMSASLPVVVASDQSNLNVVPIASGVSTVISPTVTVTAAAYSAGNCVGGKLTLTSAIRVSGGLGLLDSLFITDKANQKAAFDILIFDSDPTAGTYTDKTAIAISTDTTKAVGRIAVATGDYITLDSKAFAVKSGLGLVLKASGSTSLYAVITTSGTPTYASTSDLIVKFGIIQY